MVFKNKVCSFISRHSRQARWRCWLEIQTDVARRPYVVEANRYTTNINIDEARHLSSPRGRHLYSPHGHLLLLVLGAFHQFLTNSRVPLYIQHNPSSCTRYSKYNGKHALPSQETQPSGVHTPLISPTVYFLGRHYCVNFTYFTPNPAGVHQSANSLK